MSSLSSVSSPIPSSVLTLGDGNFSFSYSLIQKHNPSKKQLKSLFKTDSNYNYNPINLVASSYDSQSELVKKFPEAPFVIEKLLKKGVDVRHDIDATNIKQTLLNSVKSTQSHYNPIFMHNKFDTVIFNNPHTGVEDLKLHQSLLSHFFHSVEDVLNENGKIQIILANKQPKQWKLFEIAKKFHYVCIQSLLFQDDMYPGYECKRHHSARIFSLKCDYLHEFHFMRENEINSHITVITEFNNLGESSSTANSNNINNEDKSNSHDDDNSNKSNSASIIETKTVFPCTICDYSFSTEMDLKNHSAGIKPVDTNDLSIVCSVCFRGFPNERALNQHRERMKDRTDHVPLLVNPDNKEAKLNNVSSCIDNGISISNTLSGLSHQRKTRKKVAISQGLVNTEPIVSTELIATTLAGTQISSNAPI